MSRDTSPITKLLNTPHRFGFHQAVRLLGRWLRHRPDKAANATIRYRNSLSMAFPASEIARLTVERFALPTTSSETAADEVSDASPAPSKPAQKPTLDDPGHIERVDITPAFMGLLGGGGALPLFYTELFAAREEAPHRDPAARAFLDIFQHRAISLFHEAWRKHRLPLQYERDGDERYLPMALSVAGMGQDALRSRLDAARGGVADHALAYYAGALQQQHIGAVQLQRLLSSYFGVPVAVTQFVGRWFTLNESSRTVIGQANATLGAAAVVGERVWQRDLRLRLTFGPLGQADFSRFLPGSPGALALRELLTLLTGVSLEYEVRLKLRADAVNTVQLGGAQGGPRDGARDHPARLGWSTFLQSQPSASDRSEAGYDIHAVVA